MEAGVYRCLVKKIITIVDYGMGNLWSVQNAVRYLGHTSALSSDADEIRKADFLILPGVGSFRKAMETLNQTGLTQAILDAVKKNGSRILGICLGMQLLGMSGTEDGFTEGLGLVPVAVDRFQPDELGGNKVPHIGFNTVSMPKQLGLFQGLHQSADFYFVHSFKMPLVPVWNANIGTCTYGVPFTAAFQKDNVYGTQFHPEKSQTNGLILLRNFIEN